MGACEALNLFIALATSALLVLAVFNSWATAISAAPATASNPARECRISAGAPEPQETYAYNLEEINGMLAVLPEPAGSMFAVAAFAGLSRSEIAGLTWESYRDGELTVSRAIVEGKVGCPKTAARRASVPVIRQLRQRLDMHRLRCGNPQSGPMFATSKKTPLHLNNVLGRTIIPALNRCEVCHKSEDDHEEAGHSYMRDASIPSWHGWHAARRGLASNLHELGVDDKTIQRILRHSNVAVTQAHYIKSRDKQVSAAMEKLEHAIPAGAIQ